MSERGKAGVLNTEGHAVRLCVQLPDGEIRGEVLHIDRSAEERRPFLVSHLACQPQPASIQRGAAIQGETGSAETCPVVDAAAHRNFVVSTYNGAVPKAGERAYGLDCGRRVHRHIATDRGSCRWRTAVSSAMNNRAWSGVSNCYRDRRGVRT